MAGIYFYAMPAGNTFTGFSRAVRRAAMGKNVRGAIVPDRMGP